MSVYLVVTLAIGLAVFRATQGAWIEAVGLAALGIGRLLLRVAQVKPAVRSLAWFCFGITALAVLLVATR